MDEQERRRRREAIVARILRRKPYKLKPDLPGMRKRDRRFGYPSWLARYGYLKCIIRRRPNRTARHRDVDDLPQRELKPRPPAPKRNPHGYDRGRERAETRAIVQESLGYGSSDTSRPTVRPSPVGTVPPRT